MQETQETWFQSLGWEDPLVKEMATHSSILAWEIPRTEEPGRLSSMGLQRVGNVWVIEHRDHFSLRIPLRWWEEQGYVHKKLNVSVRSPDENKPQLILLIAGFDSEQKTQLTVPLTSDPFKTEVINVCKKSDWAYDYLTELGGHLRSVVMKLRWDQWLLFVFFCNYSKGSIYELPTFIWFVYFDI